jgi:hypothetical protein
MFARQLEEILAEVEKLLLQIPGTKEMLTVPGGTSKPATWWAAISDTR